MSRYRDRDRDPDQWAAAVHLIRSRIAPDHRDALREAMQSDSLAFSAAHHMSAGLTVRNLLRMNGFTEEALAVSSLDEVWADILRDALREGPDEIGGADAGKPIADPTEAALRRMEAEGLLARGTPGSLTPFEPIPLPRDVSASDLVRADRDERDG